MPRNPVWLVTGFAVLLTSLGLNIVQGTRILRLEQVIEDHGSASALSEGDSLPPLELTNETGERVMVRYDSTKPTLLYIFSPSCPWCSRNAADFAALARQTRDHLRLIGLTLSSEGIAQFARETGMDLDVYEPLPATVQRYGLAATPTTLLVSPSGRVLKIWEGAYQGTTRASIETYFKFRLPSS